MITLYIYLKERYYGKIRVKDRWYSIVPIDEEEVRKEIEERLPTLRKAKYSIAFS